MAKKTLLDLMFDADAIQIDDNFVRYFHMENDIDDEDEDEIICDIQFEQDYNMYEYYLTVKDLKEATYDKQRGAWKLEDNPHVDYITPYQINEIK